MASKGGAAPGRMAIRGRGRALLWAAPGNLSDVPSPRSGALRAVECRAGGRPPWPRLNGAPGASPQTALGATRYRSRVQTGPCAESSRQVLYSTVIVRTRCSTVPYYRIVLLFAHAASCETRRRARRAGCVGKEIYGRSPGPVGWPGDQYEERIRLPCVVGLPRPAGALGEAGQATRIHGLTYYTTLRTADRR